MHAANLNEHDDLKSRSMRHMSGFKPSRILRFPKEQEIEFVEMCLSNSKFLKHSPKGNFKIRLIGISKASLMGGVL